MTERNNIFYARDDLSMYVKASLQKDSASRNEYANSSIIRPDDIHQCSKRIAMRSAGVKPEKKLVENVIGKDYWISKVRQMEGLTVLGTDVIAGDISYGVTGFADMVVRFEDKMIDSVVLFRKTEDIKSISDGFPPRKDIMAIMMYMWLLEIKHGLLLYYTIDNQSFEIIHVIPYNPLINSMKAKIDNINKMRLLGLLPNRDHDDENSKECQSCEFFKNCWNK